MNSNGADYLELQIFPLNIKGAAGSLAIWVNWFASWIVGYTFNYLMSWNRWGNNTYILAYRLRVQPEKY